MQYNLPHLLNQWLIISYILQWITSMYQFQIWRALSIAFSAQLKIGDPSVGPSIPLPSQIDSFNQISISIHSLFSTVKAFHNSRKLGHCYISPLTSEAIVSSRKSNHRSVRTASSVWWPYNFIAFIIWLIFWTFPSSHINLITLLEP